MGTFYLLIANFFATQNIGGAKYKQWTKRVGSPFII